MGDNTATITVEEYSKQLQEWEKITADLTAALQESGKVIDKQRSKIEGLTAQNTALKHADRTTKQTLGKALGYPWWKDSYADMTASDGVCVNAKTSESLAMEAAAEIARLQNEIVRLKKQE